MQPQTGAAEVDGDDTGVGKRGSGCPDVGNVLQVSCAVIHVVWLVDVGCFPVHWEDIERLPP